LATAARRKIRLAATRATRSAREINIQKKQQFLLARRAAAFAFFCAALLAGNGKSFSALAFYFNYTRLPLQKSLPW
jgi:hypothetical protein